MPVSVTQLSLPQQQELINYLEQFLLPQRLAQMDKVIAQRTRHFVVCVEDLDKERNTNAVIRTCDCFGIQEVHVIDETGEFSKTEGISMGAHKWLDIHVHKGKANNAQDCIQELKLRDYRIIATSPHKSSKKLEELNFTEPAAFFFGSEKEGLSERILDQADERLEVPLSGFSESLNISVCAGIVMHHATLNMRKPGIDWHLPQEQKISLKLDWMIKSIRNGAGIVERYLDPNS